MYSFGVPHTDDQIEVDTQRRTVMLFRNAWNRQSSGYPDETYTFDQLLTDRRRLEMLTQLLAASDADELERQLTSDQPVLHSGYACSMSEVASRELRNDMAGVLRRVQAGEVITITVKGKPIAQLTATRPARRRWISAAELAQRLRVAQADPGLRPDLAWLAGDTTDDLGQIQ